MLELHGGIKPYTWIISPAESHRGDSVGFFASLEQAKCRYKNIQDNIMRGEIFKWTGYLKVKAISVILEVLGY